VAGTDVYEVGEQVGLAAHFGTEEAPFDPDRLVVRLRDPEGRTIQLTHGIDDSVMRVGPGAYQVVLTASVPGRWQYRFVGMSGRARAEYDGFFDVFDVALD
jgi:hypothetical protein